MIEGQEIIWLGRERHAVDYEYTPASGDGWNEERIPEHLEITSVNGIWPELLPDSVINRLSDDLMIMIKGGWS